MFAGMATRLKTTREQLVEVQEAITAVLAGQSWSLDGVSYTRADLRALNEREAQLKTQLAREQQSGVVMTFDFGGMGYD